MDNILLGRSPTEHVTLKARYANRHGLIAGATGTGKTVTLQVLAEEFSRIGVPVFLADIKGDLTGLSQPGAEHPKIAQRRRFIQIPDFNFSAAKVIPWDLYGEHGHPVRTTISDMGPTLLARLLDLNETQEGVLNIAFRFVDDEGMAMLDLDDLRTTLKFIADNRKSINLEYGNVSSASVGAIQRRLLVLEEQGAELFFGEPEIELAELIQCDQSGRGHINVLSAKRLMQQPKLYATFLLWLLSELFEELPEVGDQDKPRFVFFFDEAHLLFDDAPKALLEKIETVVRLIRSKGVGIYFVTQSPLDIPDDVLAQLGNRVQHALRAFTAKEQKAIRATAQTMRANPEFDIEETILQLGVGEAVVSTMEKDGVPGVTQQTLICPPRSRIGPATDEEYFEVIQNSPLMGKYDVAENRESAHEILSRKIQLRTEASQQKQPQLRVPRQTRSRGRQTIGEAFAKSMARSIGTKVGTQIVRGVLGSILR